MTYWEQTGKHQKTYNQLTPLIPVIGKCNDRRLELLRLVGHAYADVYNNGYPFNEGHFINLAPALLLYAEELIEQMGEENFRLVRTFIRQVADGEPRQPDEEIEAALELLADAAIVLAAPILQERLTA